MKKNPSSGRTAEIALAREDTLLSDIALAIGEPARTRILLSLMDGHARTGTELAAIAEVAPSTTSAHLNRLVRNKLIRVSSRGRHRYYSLCSPEVAAILEGLSVVAGRSVKSFVPSTPASLRRVRSCYDHMAGSLAVTMHAHFLGERWLIPAPGGKQGAYELTETGQKKLECLGFVIEDARSLRRRFAYACMDWSERKPHLGGALGAAILRGTFAKRWLVRELDSRSLCLTRLGERKTWEHLGIKI